MEFHVTRAENPKIAILHGDFFLSTESDALDIIGNTGDCDAIILWKENFREEFFDLRTGIAGAVLEKFIQYDKSIAIIGDFSGYASKSLADFIRESNRTGRIRFVRTAEEALRGFENYMANHSL